jgi:hypothetical protein
VPVIINSCFKPTASSLDIILSFHLAEIRSDYMYVLMHVRNLSCDSNGRHGAECRSHKVLTDVALGNIISVNKCPCHRIKMLALQGNICPVQELKEYKKIGGATPLILKQSIR